MFLTENQDAVLMQRQEAPSGGWLGHAFVNVFRPQVPHCSDVQFGVFGTLMCLLSTLCMLTLLVCAHRDRRAE